MSTNNDIDYATTGLNIQSARIDQYQRRSGNPMPDFILWNGRRVKTGDWWSVPKQGRLRIHLLDAKGKVEQGVDVKCEKGYLTLVDGTKIPLLRTWADPALDPVVEYPYVTRTGRLLIYNVFKRDWGGRVEEERWTGNAGFWVEEISQLDRVYHCSHGVVSKPDFDLFTFRVTVSPDGAEPPAPNR